MTETDVTWPYMTGSDLEVTAFDRKSPGSGWRWPRTCILCTFELLQGCNLQEVAVTWQKMMSRDRKWPEVTSFKQKSPGSGCRRPRPHFLSTFEFLQGCNSQEMVVTWQEMASRDLTWPEVSQKWRYLAGRHGKWLSRAENSRFGYVLAPTGLQLAGGGCHMTENDITWPDVTESDTEATAFTLKLLGIGCRWPKIRNLCTFELLQGYNSQEVAVTWQEKTSHELTSLEVTRMWRHLTGSHLEVAIEGREVAFWVRLSLYRAATRRRWQSRDRKWCHLSSHDRKWLGSVVIWQ